MVPFARNTMSRTTSPSIFRLRPSAVYSGLRFVQDVNRRVVAPSPLAAFFFGASVATVWSPKPEDCTVPLFAAARWRIGGSVAKTRARHRAANSFVAAGAIAIARSARQCGRAQTVHVGRIVRIALTGDPVRIAKSAGLHFVHWRFHRRRCCAPRGHSCPTFTSSFGRFG